MLTALIRDVGPNIIQCELTHIARDPIDVAKAVMQHQKYKKALEKAGARVVALPSLEGHPDAVFVEDTAVVLPEIAIITTLGSASRRGEEKTIAQELARLGKKIVQIESPATLEGGDVMRIGKALYVGISTRTNQEAIALMRRILDPYGYAVVPVAVTGCLHLKTGCTYAGENRILVNRSWVDARALDSYELLDVDSRESFGANSLLIGDVLLYSAKFPQTRRMLEEHGLQVVPVDISELEKAEAGLTCMSLLFDS